MLKSSFNFIEIWIEKIQASPLEILYPTLENQTNALNDILVNTDLDNNFQRSYSQYLAQKKIMPKYKPALMNLLCLMGFLPFIIFALFSRRYRPKKKSTANAVFFEKTDEVLQKSLKNRYNVHIAQKGLNLTFEDLKFLAKIAAKKPLSFYFNLKIAYKLANYRYNQALHSADAMICCSEYSFTSSIMTQWCAKNGLTHINLQHGEKLFHIMDAFAYFHEFYVWDTYYKNLLERLYVRSDQFYTELPESYLKFMEMPQSSTTKQLTYYLQTKDVSLWKQTAQLFAKLNQKYRITFRPHPRWLSENTVSDIFKNYEIENPSSVNIYESIKNTNYVCSAYSAVLLQASIAGREIIIDDVSNSQLFKKFQSLDIGILKRKHTLLSDFIEHKELK